MIRRGTICSTSSPQRSAASASTRAFSSAGNSDGDGWRRSSARAMFHEPWTRRPSSLSAGTVPPRKPTSRRWTRCAPGKTEASS